ncbi:MAG: ABC transporter permease [Acidobacteriota bacterium]
MSYEFFIALRYLRAKRRQTAISVITTVAIAGITLGVAALIIAQALITGFRDEVQEKLLQGTAHLNLLKEDNSGIENYGELTARLSLQLPGIRAASATSYLPVLLSIGDRQEQAILKAVDMNAPREANEVFVTTVEGNAAELQSAPVMQSAPEPNETPADETTLDGIVLGQQLARGLGLKLNDVITAISASTFDLPGCKLALAINRFRVVGLFASGLREYGEMSLFR